MIFYEQRSTIPMEEGYDVAQICYNGHVVNSSAKIYPQFNQKFCATCGAETTTSCSECRAPIRASYLDGLYAGYSAPSFCIYCGGAFPWTRARMQAACELARELDRLDDDDKVLLAKCIDDLITASPLAAVAATRFKKIMRKAGPDTELLFQELLTDLTPEPLRVTLWS